MERTRNRLVPVLVAVLLAAAAIVPAGMVGGAGGALAAANHAPDAPTGLSVGDRTHPLNVEGTPQFGWFPQDQDGNEIQTAYQVQLTRDSDGASIWDSGKVLSSAESYVPYAGPALADGTSYSWRVTTWDRGDLASPWSAWAHFDTGINDSEWGGATWIRRFTSGNDSTVDYTLARREFTPSSSSPIVRARAYTSAMAEYELHVNGQAIYRGDSFNYPGEGQYAVTDLTQYLTAGLPFAFGLQYYYHTCTCQGRANGAGATSTTLFAAAAASDTNVKLASVSNLLVGDIIYIDPTTLAAASLVGDVTIRVSSAIDFAAGQTVTIDTGASQETAVITTVGTSGSSGTGITVSAALTKAHASGVTVIGPNQEFPDPDRGRDAGQEHHAVRRRRPGRDQHQGRERD